MFQEQLDTVDQRIAKLRGRMTKDDQNVIGPLQEQLATKDAECSLIQKELSEAISAKSVLEAGNSKARVEIHDLFRRVEESESWARGTKEKSIKLNIDPSKEATRNKLETLQDCMKSPTRQDPNCRYNDKNPASPSQGFQRTEFIYRSQSIQPGAHSPRVAGAGIGLGQNIQSRTNIVPFSAIQEQISPEQADSQEENLGALSDLFMASNDNKHHHCTPTNALDSSGPEPTVKADTERKTKPSNLQGGHVDKAGKEIGPKDLSQSAPHQIRRTYSRNHQESARDVPNAPLPPATRRMLVESPCGGRNSKRAKISTASSFKPRRETSHASDYFEPIPGTPAGKAPENRHLPASGNMPGQGKTTKGQRRSGRISRGKIEILVF